MELKIEYVPIDELKTYENNAKIHTAEQIEQIKKSIEEFGMNDPIAVWKDNVIIEGHGRLIALTELNAEGGAFSTVPVIRLDNLTDEQRKAYGIVHNKLTMNTSFDMDALADGLKELLDNFDFTELGFGAFEIDAITTDFTPEGYDDFGGQYDGVGERDLKVKKLIITYKDEQEDDLRNFLGIGENEVLKVLYSLGELL